MKKLLIIVMLALATPAAAQTAREEIGRFVDFYAAEVKRTGIAPDETSTRESRIAFLQQTVKGFCSPLLAMKRASDTRPISDEVVVYVGIGPEYRAFADFIPNGGSSAWRLSKELDSHKLEIAQPLVNPLTLGRLTEATFAPTVPGCKSQVPSPKPEPQPPAHKPYPGDAFFVEKIGAVLEADYAEAGQTLNAGSATWFARPIWGYVNEGLTIEQAVARARKEWRAALGLPQ